MLEAAAFAHALADVTRWRIALLVADQMLCVCELEDGLRLPQSTLSSHLTVLRASGLLEVERRGKWAWYKMSPALRPLFKTLRAHFAESLAGDLVLQADRARIAERVSLRGQTDCGTARRRAIPPVLKRKAAPCC